MTGPLAGGHLMIHSQNPSGKTVPPCIQHVTYPSCAFTAGQEMWDKVLPVLSQRSVSKRAWHSYPSSPPKMPLFIPKTPENPLLSVPCSSFERFFLEM